MKPPKAHAHDAVRISCRGLNSAWVTEEPQRFQARDQMVASSMLVLCYFILHCVPSTFGSRR